MRHLLLTSFVALLAISCSTDDSNTAAFVTMLGNDTLAVEQFVKTDTSIIAQVVLRTPQTSMSSYALVWDDEGGIESMVKRDYDTSVGFTGSSVVSQTVARTGDSLSVEVVNGDQSRSYKAPYQPGVLPFIDMVHWPFELAFMNAVETGQDTVNQPLLSGNRISNFVIAAIEGDSMTIRHPFRGVMGVNVNDNGELEFLDAGLTTRKLKVYRHNSVNIDQIGKSFARQDREGNTFGSLSGAVEADFEIGNDLFTVQYGSPLKRGRDLFGGIVPYGEIWRTGANRATHFTTPTDIRIGDTEVPAGEYTLFSIPKADGGTLIINSQTGQNGNSYDESRDLGRVPMEVSIQDEVTEAFTITVEETDEGGRINLIWGDTVYSTDFVIE